MPWNKQEQEAAVQQSNAFKAEFKERYDAWKNAVLAGNAGTGQAATEDVLRRWRQHQEILQSKSDMIMSNESIMDNLGQLATQVAEEKNTLAKLQGKATTRADQADSVNPKVRGSPYTNILGLQRTFRDSTRFTILLVSIVFAILALCALSYLVYSLMTQETTASFIGGAHKRRT